MSIENNCNQYSILLIKKNTNNIIGLIVNQNNEIEDVNIYSSINNYLRSFFVKLQNNDDMEEVVDTMEIDYYKTDIGNDSEYKNLYTGKIIKINEIKNFNTYKESENSVKFSLLKNSENDIKKIIDDYNTGKYNNLNNEIANTLVKKIIKYNNYNGYYRINSEKVLFVLGDKSLIKSKNVFKDNLKDYISDKFSQFIFELGFVDPIEINYDDMITNSKLFEELKNICEVDAFKITYNFLKEIINNIKKYVIENVKKFGLPIIIYSDNLDKNDINLLIENNYNNFIFCILEINNLKEYKYQKLVEEKYIKNMMSVDTNEYIKIIKENINLGLNIEGIFNYNLSDNKIQKYTKDIFSYNYKKSLQPFMQDITSKLTIKDNKYNCNYYRFNNSIIHYNENFYLCVYRIVIGSRNIQINNKSIKTRDISSGKYPEMWATYIYNNEKKVGLLDYNNNSHSNGFWESITGIALCMLELKDNYFSVVPNSEKIINIGDDTVYNNYTGGEDPRLYRKADNNIYMYYMGKEQLTNFRNPDSNKSLKETLKKNNNLCFDNQNNIKNECLFVSETKIIISKNNFNQYEYNIKSNMYDENDINATKIFCLKSQIDNMNKNNNIVFDKNFSPFVLNSKDYFGYTISKKYKIYERDIFRGGNTINCNNIVDNNMIKIFSDLFNMKCKDRHLIHSISQNTPAISFNDNEYIAVGHMRAETSFYTNNNSDYIGKDKNLLDEISKQNPSLANFLCTHFQDFSESLLFVHPHIYFMFFYTFSKKYPHEILRISDCFIPNYKNRKYNLCFAMSLIFKDNKVRNYNNEEKSGKDEKYENNDEKYDNENEKNKFMFLTFGEGDVYCRTLIMYSKLIDNMLKDINEIKLENYKFSLLDVKISNKEILVPDSNETLIDNLIETSNISRNLIFNTSPYNYNFINT